MKKTGKTTSHFFPMYKSKIEIDKKLKQLKYVHKLIRNFEGRVMAGNGRDPETGAHPLIAHLSAFVAHGRSVIQYAHKEAKGSEHLKEYEEFVKNSEIFELFKNLRNSDIHEYNIGANTVMEATVYVDPNKDRSALVSNTIKISIESLSDLDKPKKKQPHVKVSHNLCKRVETTDSLVENLERNGKADLAQEARMGKELYEVLEFQGNKDLHKLCDKYVKELERFIDFGHSKDFIS